MIRQLVNVLGEEHSGPVRRTVVLMTLAATAEGAAYALLLPILRAVLNGDTGAASPWLWALVAAVACYGVLRYAADLSGFRAGTTLLRGSYYRLGDQLARLPVGWYAGNRVGEISALASDGVLQVMGAIAHLLGPLISAIVTPLTIIVVMSAIDWRFGVAAALAIPFAVVVQRRTASAIEVADTQRAAAAQEAVGRVIEFVRAQPILRVGSRSRGRFELLDAALRGMEHSSRAAVRATIPGVVGLSLAVQVTFTGLLALGAFLAVGGRIGAVEVIVLLVLAARCAGPLLSLAELGGEIKAARADLSRLEYILGAEPLPEPALPDRPSRHDLRVDSIRFQRNDSTVIDDVSLTLPAGGRLAIVGPSGSGKSTLLHLLARFHDVDGGAIRWGRKDVRSIGTEALTDMVAIVFQDVYLFDDTIEENIRLGRPDADQAAVREAATAAGLDEVVDRLPDGWDTRVGEGGHLLSGGERQRVSIARALLKDAPVVLLDEITSALDPVTAAVVQAGIDRLMAGRTVVMVAHRLEAAPHADQVAFLDEGRIVERGTHNELLAADGRYAQFWRVSTTGHKLV